MKRLQYALAVLIIVGCCLGGGPLFAAAKASPKKSLPPDVEKSVQGLFDLIIDRLWVRSDEYWHKGDYESAIAIEKIIVGLDPTVTEAYGVAAWLMESLGREDEALKHLEGGLKANLKRYELYFEIGHYYFKRKKYDLAREYFSKACLYPRPDTADRMLAHACEKMNDLEASLKVWKDLVKVPERDSHRQ